jgi:hypothetical protein
MSNAIPPAEFQMSQGNSTADARLLRRTSGCALTIVTPAVEFFQAAPGYYRAPFFADRRPRLIDMPSLTTRRTVR